MSDKQLPLRQKARSFYGNKDAEITWNCSIATEARRRQEDERDLHTVTEIYGRVRKTLKRKTGRIDLGRDIVILGLAKKNVILDVLEGYSKGMREKYQPF